MQRNHIILLALSVGLLTIWFEPLDAFVRRSVIYPWKCSLPKLAGSCRLSIRRYFFNMDRRACEPFIYSGCHGNQNNFIDLYQCSFECGRLVALPETCKQPKEPGRCREHLPRFYYNMNTEMCEWFLYTGCGGNENNFETMGDCYWMCKTSDQ